jgi:hypothetical protein
MNEEKEMETEKRTKSGERGSVSEIGKAALEAITIKPEVFFENSKKRYNELLKILEKETQLCAQLERALQESVAKINATRGALGELQVLLGIKSNETFSGPTGANKKE